MIFAGIINETENELSVVDQYLKELWPKVFRLGLQLLIVLVIFIIGSKCISILRRFVKRSLERTSADTGLIQFLDGLTKYLLYFVLFMIILGRFGVQATSIFALAGSAGLTLGLALQGSLSNFAGGVLILLLKPFTVGDYIIEDTHKNEGTVEKIQLFYTTLVTIDQKRITVPNATLANTSLTNVTGCKERQLVVRVSISYESDIRLAKKMILQVFQKEKRILQDKEMTAFVSELGEHGVLMEGRAWVPTEDFFPVMWQVLEDIKYCFDENGIVIPYPQMDVHMSK